MIEKQRAKAKLHDARTFGEWAEKWLEKAPMAESTRAMRRSIYERDIKRPFQNRPLHEIEPQDIRALCERIVARDAPATAIHVREIIKLIFAFARLHGVKIENPANDVSPASIATFTPRERSLSPKEIRIFFPLLEAVPTLPTIRPGLKLILLTLVRKGRAAVRDLG